MTNKEMTMFTHVSASRQGRGGYKGGFGCLPPTPPPPPLGRPSEKGGGGGGEGEKVKQ